MKKVVLILLAAALLAGFAACQKTPTIEVVKPTDRPALDATLQPGSTDIPLKTYRPDRTEPPFETPAPPPPTISAGPTPSPTPSGPAMYSSYAFMVSYNPATGIAEFDYFDMLTGEDAVDWLVDHEGYSQTDAENEVAMWGDGEHITKNTNPQLRAINLADQQLTLMYDPATVPAFVVAGVPSTKSDADALYALNPAYLFDHFFFYIHVSGGVVTHVEQVYWC